MRRLAPGAVAVLALAAFFAPQPVAGSSLLQAVYAQFDATAANAATGLVFADHISSGAARVTVALGNLVDGHRYRVVFSSTRCFDPDNQTDHVAKASLGTASAAGHIFESQSVRAVGSAWRGVWSVRLIDRKTAAARCLSSNRLEWPTAGGRIDGAFARFGAARGIGVLAGSGGQRELRLAVNRLEAKTRYRLMNISVKCNDGDPAVVTRLTGFRTDQSGTAFVARTVTVDSAYVVNDGALDVELRSTGEDWDCATLHPYTLFLPPAQP